jgi:hypothetical protein
VPAAQILVIAISPEFRDSLVFALESEGYEVTARPDIPEPGSANLPDAVVLDHRAASLEPKRTVAFCRTTGPVILLAAQALPWLLEAVFTVVPTPLMGDALSRAVAQAVQVSGSSK